MAKHSRQGSSHFWTMTLIALSLVLIVWWYVVQVEAKTVAIQTARMINTDAVLLQENLATFLVDEKSAKDDVFLETIPKFNKAISELKQLKNTNYASSSTSQITTTYLPEAIRQAESVYDALSSIAANRKAVITKNTIEKDLSELVASWHEPMVGDDKPLVLDASGGDLVEALEKIKLSDEIENSIEALKNTDENWGNAITVLSHNYMSLAGDEEIELYAKYIPMLLHGSLQYSPFVRMISELDRIKPELGSVQHANQSATLAFSELKPALSKLITAYQQELTAVNELVMWLIIGLTSLLALVAVLFNFRDRKEQSRASDFTEVAVVSPKSEPTLSFITPNEIKRQTRAINATRAHFATMRTLITERTENTQDENQLFLLLQKALVDARASLQAMIIELAHGLEERLGSNKYEALLHIEQLLKAYHMNLSLQAGRGERISRKHITESAAIVSALSAIDLSETEDKTAILMNNAHEKAKQLRKNLSDILGKAENLMPQVAEKNSNFVSEVNQSIDVIKKDMVEVIDSFEKLVRENTLSDAEKIEQDLTVLALNQSDNAYKTRS